MTITQHKGQFALDSLEFTVDKVDYLITGTHVDPWGNTIDDVKNLSTKVWKEIERSRLVRILTNAGYKTVKHGKT